MPQIRKDVIATLNRCAGRNKYKPDQLKESSSTFGINTVLIRISELLMQYPNGLRNSMDSSNVTDEKASGEVFL